MEGHACLDARWSLPAGERADEHQDLSDTCEAFNGLMSTVIMQATPAQGFWQESTCMSPAGLPRCLGLSP